MVSPDVLPAVAPIPGRAGSEAQLLVSFTCIALLVAKELAATYPGVEPRVGDALTAALVPVLGGFVAIVLTYVG